MGAISKLEQNDQESVYIRLYMAQLIWQNHVMKSSLCNRAYDDIHNLHSYMARQMDKLMICLLDDHDCPHLIRLTQHVLGLIRLQCAFNMICMREYLGRTSSALGNFLAQFRKAQIISLPRSIGILSVNGIQQDALIKNA